MSLAAHSGGRSRGLNSQPTVLYCNFFGDWHTLCFNHGARIFNVPEDWCHSYTGPPFRAWIRTACGCHSPLTSSSFFLPHVGSVHRMTTEAPLLMYNGAQDYHLEAPQSTYLVQPIVTPSVALGGHGLVLLLLGTLSPAGSEPWFPAWQSSTLRIRPHTPTIFILLILVSKITKDYSYCGTGYSAELWTNSVQLSTFSQHPGQISSATWSWCNRIGLILIYHFLL